MTPVLAAIVALLVVLVVLTEIVSAVLPLVIVLICVPERERDSLARLLAVCDSSRRLRMWPALRLAVVLRRQELAVQREARDPERNPYAHLEAHFAQMPEDAPVNAPHAVIGLPPDGLAGSSGPAPAVPPCPNVTDAPPHGLAKAPGE